MNIILGVIILIAAGWLMYRLQAKGGCCGHQEGDGCCPPGEAAGSVAGEVKDRHGGSRD